MWKKDEAMPDAPREMNAAPRRPEVPRSTPPTPAGRAVIGPSITIRGEVSGDEDLMIQGNVDGSVALDLHALTVGREGRVKANITARVITVEGEVEGDLRARDQVVLRSEARVMGDITAPRVVLEDGANFRGLVDMGAAAEAASASDRKVSAGSTPKLHPSGKATSGADGKASEATHSSSSTTTTAPGKDEGSSATVSKATS